MTDPQKIMLGTATCKDLMQCMMNLGELEMDILKRLVKNGPLRSEDLTRQIKKDKSIIHRGLQRLMSCGMVIREKRTIRQGGYFFVYSALPIEHVQDKMKECIDRMYTNMKALVERFDLFDGEKGPRKKRS
jgi:predicted transcriptional regulator